MKEGRNKNSILYDSIFVTFWGEMQHNSYNYQYPPEAGMEESDPKGT